MQVPFYIIMATEDNIINNFDPRVIRRPYHQYKTDFNVLMNAQHLHFETITKVKATYKTLKTVKDIKEIKDPSYYIDRGELPKIQPILADDNVFSRLAKNKTTIHHVDVKKETEYKYYHTQNN